VYASLERARALVEGRSRPRVVWPLWSSPLLAAGRGSFLTDLLDVAGAENIFGDVDAPSPQVTFEEIVRRDPDVVLAGPVQSAELRSDPRWRALRAVREGRVLIYDTTLVGRPGVRLGEAALHLVSLLHAGAGSVR
jgi:ABC-type Fe3+-hydroxamate transport system substrate-binding protein